MSTNATPAGLRPARPGRASTTCSPTTSEPSAASVRRLCERRRAARRGLVRARAGSTTSAELTKQLGDLGVLGMHLEGYGCAGMSAIDYGLACLELEACDSGIRSLVSVQGSLAMFAIWRWGSEEQKQEWLPRMAAGEAIGCFGLTEPDDGSDPGAMRTRARAYRGRLGPRRPQDVDHQRFHRRRRRGLGPDRRRRARLRRARPTPRASRRRRSSTSMSLRASVTSELVLDDVRLPGSAVFPRCAGSRGRCRASTRPATASSGARLGAARSSLEAAVRYAVERTQFGKPIAGFQLTQQKLADMTLELVKGELLALHLGRRKDAGRLRPEQVSLGKLNNVREALEICRTARTILGANGISLEYPVIRHANNLESVLTYEGTVEMHTLVLGQAMTGIAAFR